MSSTVAEIFIALVAALITALATYHTFYLEKSIQMKENRLTQFYYPALKILKKYIGRNISTPEAQKDLQELINLAENQEIMLDNETKCAICNFQSAYKRNRSNAKKTWCLCYECKSVNDFDKQKAFDKLYRIIRINCFYLGESINWSTKNIRPNNAIDKSWMKKKKREKARTGCLLYVAIAGLFVSLWFLAKYI